MPKEIRIKWTEEEKKIIEENCKTLSKKELLVLLQKITPERTIGSIKCYYKDHHIITGKTGRFEKGSIPANKGKKVSPETLEKIKGTWFKKGESPNNSHPIGHEVMRKRHHHTEKHEYVYVKVAEPDVWRPKHHLIWEEAHGVSVPEGCRVIFLDGNRLNFSPENLELVTNGENIHLNSSRLVYRNWKGSEEKRIALDLIRLESKLKEMEK